MRVLNGWSVGVPARGRSRGQGRLVPGPYPKTANPATIGTPEPVRRPLSHTEREALLERRHPVR